MRAQCDQSLRDIRYRTKAVPLTGAHQPYDGGGIGLIKAAMNMEIKRAAVKAFHVQTFSILLLLALTCYGAVTASAQGTTPQRGFAPGGSYALTDIETVNTVNGNLMLRVPLASLPAGRGGTSANLSLIYNSKLWDTPPMLVPEPNNTGNRITSYHLKPGQQGGWHYGLEYKLQLINKLDEQMYSAYSPNCESDAGAHTEFSTRIWKLQIIFPDGSTHEMAPQGYQDSLHTYGDGYYDIRPDGSLIRCECVSFYGQWQCSRPTYVVNTGAMTYYSTDGTYLKLEVPHDDGTGISNKAWTLYTPDGGRITGTGIIGTYDTSSAVGSQRIYDRNNNYVEIQHTTFNSHRADRIIDQFERSILIEYGSATNQDSIYATGAGGVPLLWQVNWKTIYVRKTAYTDESSTAYTQELNQILPVVASIVLPSQSGGLTYSFTYNGGETDNYPNGGVTYGWGELSSITLPSGAKAEYAYKQDNVNVAHWYEVLQNHPVTKVLKYSAENDGASAQVSETWDYLFNFNYHTSTSTRTSVTAPDGGVTTDEVKYVSGYAFDNGTSFRTTQPDGTVVERYWQPNVPSGQAGVSCASCNAYVKTEYTSIRDADGALSKTAIKDFNYDKNGNVTQTAEYDWVAYGDVPRTNPGFGLTGTPTGIPASAPLKRVVVNKYYNPTPDASNATTTDPDSYCYANSSRLRGAVQWSEIRDPSQPTSRTEFTYDDPSMTGNLTLQRNWDTTKGPLAGTTQDDFRLGAGNSISLQREYDDNTPNPAQRFGNLTLSVDANGNRTKYAYGVVLRPSDGAVFTALYPTEVVAAEGTSVKRTTSSVYDFWSGRVTRVTDEENQVSTSTAYDALGRPTLIKEADGARDANNVSLERQTSTEYSDTLRRVIVRTDMNATGDAGRISVQHYDQLGRPRLSRTLEDSMAEAAEDDAAGVKIQSRYLTDRATGLSYQLTSNPYRAAHSYDAGGEATMGWTLSTSDRGERAVRAEIFGGATPPAPFATSSPNTNSTGAVVSAYDGESVTTTDQALRKRKTVTDAFGRLVQVYEAPGVQGYNFLTSYSYNALGNVTQVAQGSQTRTFFYSSLSRLTSATSPEGGQVDYEYDNNGNLKTKTDPRLIPNTQTRVNVTYDYDALNRVKSRTYNDSTPDVVYTYDSQPLPAGALAFERGLSAGRLIAVTYGGGSAGYYTGGYDALGRAGLSQQVTDTGAGEGLKTYGLAYGYYLDGRVKSETYPSGKTIETQYDAAGRVAGVKSQAGVYYAGGNPATPNNPDVIKYAVNGAPSAVRLGNGLWEHTNFNSRLQTSQIGLGTTAADSSVLKIDYAYGEVANGALDPSKNNGNVQSQTITYAGVAAPLAQTYLYDPLNRLQSAEEKSGAATTWRQVYSYDRFGNRNFAAGTTSPDLSQTPLDPLTGLPIDPVRNPAIDAATNRIKVSAAGQGDYGYDAAGNLTCEPGRTCAQGQASVTPYYDYDAENRIKSAAGGYEGGGTTYTYDGEGRRVRKSAYNGEDTVFVYDAAGRMVAEYSNQVEHKGTRYLTQDHIGSTRAVTDAQGNAHSNNGAGGSRHDYMPFGEEIGVGVGGRTATQGYTQQDNVRQKFAGKERDAETGLDYFGGRYYGKAYGRFTSPDPLLSSGQPANPKTWNRYAYALNNPLRLVDPSGLFVIDQDMSQLQHDQIIEAYNKLVDSLNKVKEGSKAYKSITRALKRLGKPGERNGVVVKVGTTSPEASGETSVRGIAKGTVTITFNETKFDDEGTEGRAAVLGHEAVHADDAFNLYDKLKNYATFIKQWRSNDVRYRTEYDAYWVDAGVAQVTGKPLGFEVYTSRARSRPGYPTIFPFASPLIWDPAWKDLDQQEIENKQGGTIRLLLEEPEKGRLDGYGLKSPKDF
jgi:RHS repeat-associated protein